MIHDSIVSCIGDTPLVSLPRLFAQPGVEVFAKLEFLNPGGSVKDRSARYIIEQGFTMGRLSEGAHIVESTSGNLGVALAMVARIYGLRFTAVVDPNTTFSNVEIMRHYGAEIDMVQVPDECGGYLNTRLARVNQLLDEYPDAVWINQYVNELNWQAHYEGTGREILAQLAGPVDYLVAAVSTCGTIHGTARMLRQVHPGLRVVAVDAVGSVIFGGRPEPRRIPGIGASKVPGLLRRDEIDRVLTVGDDAAVRGCRELLATEAIFAGGSSGAVVAGIQELAAGLTEPARIVTLFPDRGERYLDIVYNSPRVPVAAGMGLGV